MKYEFVYFDVADTLLYKEGLYEALQTSLAKFDYNFDKKIILQKHRLVSELIPKPERTTKEFYDHFNSEFLYSMGVVPRRDIVDTIFESCKNLKWKKFSDTDVIKKYRDRIGIISNWDSNLRRILSSIFDFEFKKIIISSEVGIAKPVLGIYKKALSELNVPKSKVVYIGNSVKLDMVPAMELGMKAVLLDRDNFYPDYQYAKLKSFTEIEGFLMP